LWITSSLPATKAELVGHVLEERLVGEKVEGDAVHRHRAGVDVPLGVHIDVVVAAGELAVDDLDAGDFDQPVAGLPVEAGGFGIQNDLSHALLPPASTSLPVLRTASTPRRARASALSFSTWPAWPRTHSHLIWWRRLGVERAPQVFVLDRRLRGGLPAPRLPAVDPLGNALLHILRVGVHRAATGRLRA
jgi:hypothetical protein